jgi:hypothetical protein
MTDSNILKDLAESFKLPTAKWPNHQVVLDLWTRRDEIDKLVQLLDVAAEWEYVDDGANIPYYKLQSEKSPVFAMLVAGSRTSMLWRLSIDPNTQQLTQVSDNLVFGKPDKIMSDAKAAVRASLVASRAAFDSISNWLIRYKGCSIDSVDKKFYVKCCCKSIICAFKFHWIFAPDDYQRLSVTHHRSL